MGKDRTKENLKMLDEIDFNEFFSESSESIWDLRTRVDEKYSNTDFSNNDVMEGCVFNWVSCDELGEYLEERYPEKFHFYEVSDWHYYVD